MEKEESETSNTEVVEIIRLQVFDLFASKIKKLLKEKCNFSPVGYRNLYWKGVLDKALNLVGHDTGQQVAQKLKSIFLERALGLASLW